MCVKSMGNLNTYERFFKMSKMILIIIDLKLGESQAMSC